MIKLAVIGPLLQQCSGDPIPKHAVYTTVILCLQVSNTCIMDVKCLLLACKTRQIMQEMALLLLQIMFHITGIHSLTGHTLS